MSVWSKYPIKVNGKVLTPLQMWDIQDAFRVRYIAERIVDEYKKDDEAAMSLAREIIEVMDYTIEGISEDDAVEYVMAR